MIRFWRSLAPLGRWVLTIGAVLFLLTVIGGVHSCRMAATARTEARLQTNQTSAAIASGADAANTVGDVGARAADTDRTTMENADEIRSAPGADAPVDRGVHDAGLRSLCKRAAYRGRPECLQQPAAE